jgi:hypothetical protein
MALDPLDPRTPEQIIADEAAAAEQYLDYRPDITRPIPKSIPGIPEEPGLPSLHGLASATKAGRTVLGALATYGDILEIRKYQAKEISRLASHLAGVRVAVVGSPALTSQEQVDLSNAAGSHVTVGEVRSALLNLRSEYSPLVLKAWSRHMRDQNLVAGQLYINLFRTSEYYAPHIQKTTETLLEIMAYGLLHEPNGRGTTVYAQTLAERFHSLSIDGRVAAPYYQVQSTVSAMTSEMTNTVGYIVGTNNAGSDPTSQNALQCAIDHVGLLVTGNTINFAGEILEIIEILKALRFIIILASTNGWIKFLNLEGRINALIQALATAILSEAVNAFAQIEAMMLTPVEKLMMAVAGAFGGYLNPCIDQFGGVITNLLAEVNGKFQKELLNLYRGTWVHLNLTDSSTSATGSDASTKRILAMLDLLISALETAESFEQAAETAGGEYRRQQDATYKLPKLPVIENITPPQNATLDQLTSSHGMGWGLRTLPGENAEEMAKRYALRIR